MKYFSKYLPTGIIIVITLTFLHSCFFRIPNKKHFTYYAKNNISPVGIQLEGFYFMVREAHINYPHLDHTNDPKYYIKVFFFYKDGTFKSGGNRSYNLIPTREFITELIGYMEEDPDEWGAYVIEEDSIKAQYFVTKSVGIANTDIIEMVGYIKNDTTIVIEKELCNWCDNQFSDFKKGVRIFNPPREYHFQPFEIKPDSSKAWFKKKKWYKKGLRNK